MCSHCPPGLYNLDIMIIKQIECNKLLVTQLGEVIPSISKEFWVTVRFVKYDFLKKIFPQRSVILM